MRYYLFGFTNGEFDVITRGSNVEQAIGHIASSGIYKRGDTISPLNSLPINSNELYSENHDEGWFTRIPNYLKKKNDDEYR